MKSHSDHPLNELADSLCTSQMSSEVPESPQPIFVDEHVLSCLSLFSFVFGSETNLASLVMHNDKHLFLF